MESAAAMAVGAVWLYIYNRIGIMPGDTVKDGLLTAREKNFFSSVL